MSDDDKGRAAAARMEKLRQCADSLAKADALLQLAERGAMLPDDDVLWALRRLYCFLAIERANQSAEQRDFGESP